LADCSRASHGERMINTDVLCRVVTELLVDIVSVGG
jgi:hypothetical protein